MSTVPATEIREIPPGVPSLTRRWRQLLADCGLEADFTPDYTCALADADDRLLGAASLCGNIIKGVAIDESLRGTDAAPRLLTAVRDEGLRRGHANLFLFTKPQYRDMFASMAFHPVGSGDGAALLESRRSGLPSYLNYLRTLPRGARNGVIVMNVNPLTLGHLHLIRTAAASVDRLTVIPVADNPANRFSYTERTEMLRSATAGLDNVCIARGSDYVISASTFPTYFIKSLTDRAEAHISLDLDIFCRHIAPALDATVRFAGTEPSDPLTALYNTKMRDCLPAAGIDFIEIDRLADAGGHHISASAVRACLDHGPLTDALVLVPDATVPYLLGHAAADALLAELDLTPKPGLVDRDNNGAHTDMDYQLMLRSILTLRPWFVRLCALAMRRELPDAALLAPCGIEAERRMLEATGGINTHRGALFSLGLTICAAAWLHHNRRDIRAGLRPTIAAIAATYPEANGTHGRAVAERFGIPTALQTARDGYAPLFDEWLTEPDAYRRLLRIIASLPDSNLYYRGGREGAEYARMRCGALLRCGADSDALRELDADFTSRNLSPGGAADMLALSFLADKLIKTSIT